MTTTAAAGVTRRPERSLAGVAGPVAALVVAAVLSSSRFVAAPGFEFYLGPLFYMLAYRWFGLRAGLLTALVTMAPTIIWWGHPVSLALAVGHVLAIHRFSRRFSLSTITLAYQATIGSAAALLLVGQHHDVPIQIMLVVTLRKLLWEMALAAVADCILLFFRREQEGGRFVRERSMSLPSSLDALISLIVSGAATLFLLGALHRLPSDFDTLRTRFENAVRQDAARFQPSVGRVGTIEGIIDGRALPFTVASPGRVDGALRALGCQRLDADPAGGPNDRNTFIYWLDICLVAPMPGGRVALLSPRAAAVDLFVGILNSLLPLLAFLLFAEGAIVIFRRWIWQSSSAWDAAVRQFGRGERIDLPPAFFRETDDLLHQFAKLNNDFVIANDERHRLGRAVDELRAAIGLKLVSAIRFDPAAGALRFTKLLPERGPVQMAIAVDPADHHILASSAGMNDAVVEFRVADTADAEWYLLLAHEFDSAESCWRYGCIIRLRTARAFHAQMRQNARLIELGGMASALSHELRQPLFTISLAAENGRLLLDPAADASAAVVRKFDRILEQVERATAIVERTSAYARHERDDRQPVDLVQITHNAVRFMRPVLVDRDIQIRVDAPESLPAAMLPKVGIEQILVNALQNAADSIDHARSIDPAHPASIDIDVTVVPDVVTIAIRDSGAGVAESIRPVAFSAFSTTKPEGKGTGLGLYVCRQIMDELGGSLSLTNNADAPGATLTLCIPVGGRG